MHAQQIPLNQVVQNRLSELLLDADSSVFTGFRSQNWLEFEQLNIIHKTSVEDSVFGLSNALKSNIRNTNLIRAVGTNSVFTLDPYLDAGIGKSNEKDSALTEFFRRYKHAGQFLIINFLLILVLLQTLINILNTLIVLFYPNITGLIHHQTNI